MDPVLTTPRLDLYRPQPHDHAALLTLLGDDEVRLHLGNRPTSAVEEFNRLCRNAGSWALYGYGTFICRTRGSDAVLGICGVFHSWRGFGKGMDDTPEIGWIFARETWGRGIASEAASAALAWFDANHGPLRVACMIEDGNAASFAVASRLGFVEYARHFPDEAVPGEGEMPLVLLERG
ncbi:GNAT family N-acetyltransferase [Novosphingobium lentum]|uniref:GNAT family N-acetyltransferase n=1 Tax=Novosphingobium lentum TaxID=145287 RepID=UPI0008295E9A|nr:GNAT family protein [Novosphingobium lentum]